MDSLDAVGATDVPQEEFNALGEGDILFVDTTHTVKVGGDVNRVLLEVLPALTLVSLCTFTMSSCPTSIRAAC